MKIFFDMEYIGNVEFNFKNKYEIFEFYKDNNGRIESNCLPLYNEFKEYEAFLEIIGRPICEIRIDIDMNIEDINKKINNIKLKNEKIKAEVDKLKMYYMKQTI